MGERLGEVKVLNFITDRMTDGEINVVKYFLVVIVLALTFLMGFCVGGT